MREYFIVANSFAAPFCSDQSHSYQKGSTPESAMMMFAAEYSHPCGLYSAQLFESADAYHKNKPFLCEWHSNRVIAEKKATAGKGAYTFYGESASRFSVDGVWHDVENPKGGRVITAE